MSPQIKITQSINFAVALGMPGRRLCGLKSVKVSVVVCMLVWEGHFAVF